MIPIRDVSVNRNHRRIVSKSYKVFFLQADMSKAKIGIIHCFVQQNEKQQNRVFENLKSGIVNLKNARPKPDNPKKMNEISQQASCAINYIYEKMQSQAAQLFCQPALIDATPDAAINARSANGACSNDDRVLKCALQLKKRIPLDDKILLLCTNDKNLINKAGANEIVAGEYKTGEAFSDQVISTKSLCPLSKGTKKSLYVAKNHLSFLLNDMVYNTPRYVRPPECDTKPTPSETESLVEVKNPRKSSQSLDLNDYPDGNSFEDILEFTLLVFSQIVESEFRRVYDKDADKIFVIQPPWESLKVVIEVVLKHWVAVYKYMWKRMEDFQALYKYLILKRQMDLSEEIEVLRLVEKLLTSIKDACKKAIPITAKSLSKRIAEFFVENHVEDREEKKTKSYIKGERKCKKSDEDCAVSLSSSCDSKKKSSSEVVAERWAEISMEEKEKKRVRQVCQDIWNLIESKKNEWTKILIGNESHGQKTEARQNLLKLCRVSQVLLDSMDAVFRDQQPKKGEEFSSLAHFPGAESFIRLLSHFPSCLDKTVKKFDTVLDMRSFQLFMSDADD
uniref:PIN domain-containing protein n=1 Tax=Romanomermis culicivorax TaxID=13658 RepID=A0A915KQV0_ROMCU